MAKSQKTRKGNIIAITSGKGGVGKSNIAVNLSIALVKMGKSVTLFDADAHYANVNVLMGKTNPFTLADVVFGERSISDITLRDASGLRIISAHSGMGDLGGLENRVKEHFFHEIYNLTQEDDFIIIDTSAGLSDTLMDFSLRADEIVVVTTPEPTAVSDAYALMKVLFGLKDGIRFSALINLVESKNEADEVFERFSLVVEHFLNTVIGNFGFIIEDKAVRNAVQKQDPFIRAFPGCNAAKCIHQIAQRMLS